MSKAAEVAVEPIGQGIDAGGLSGVSQVSSAEGYARWAESYDRTPNPLLAREERYLLPLLGNLRHQRVLDLACGTGRWLEKLIAHGAEFGVGIDSSAAMLRIAGEKDAIRRRLARAECTSLPFESSRFDLVVCSFVLGHIEALGSIARELARVTRPGGRVLISDLHPEAVARGWQVGFRDERGAVRIETFHRTVEETISAFTANEFECEVHDSLWLGEPERQFFAMAGKLDSFAEACRVRAVLVCEFRRFGKAEMRK